MAFLRLLLFATLLVHPPGDVRCAAAQPSMVELEIRVFDGQEEITAETTVRVFPAGTRERAQEGVPGPGRGVVLDVPVGRYDVQAIHERQGQVVGVRWAEGLLAQRYPDEPGRHLEVINLRRGFGALKIQGASSHSPSSSWDAVAYAPGDRLREAGRAVAAADYLVFALSGGRYDVAVRRGAAEAWLENVEVPADRTRLVPEPDN